jgi:two-component system cell cycle response regulator
MLVNTRYIPELGWRLVVEQEEDAAISPLRRVLVINLLISALITIFVLLVARYTVNYYQGRLEEMAATDKLTGLYNRRYFDRHMHVMLGKAHSQDRRLALMILDVDHFKAVNDTHGHDAGDLVLKEFSARLKRNIRGVDLACRFGGEEFVVLMPDTDQNQAEAVAERVRQAVAERAFEVPGGRSLWITVSAGVALRESDSDTAETLIKRADVALYRAKREGRNRVVFDAA